MKLISDKLYKTLQKHLPPHIGLMLHGQAATVLDHPDARIAADITAWFETKDEFTTRMRAAALKPAQPGPELKVSACYFPSLGEAELTWERNDNGETVAIVVPVTEEDGKKLANTIYGCTYWTAEAAPTNLQPVAEIAIEPDYWNRGILYEGHKKTAKPLQNLETLALGEKLYTKATIVHWRNDAIEACAKIAEAYGNEQAAVDMRAMLRKESSHAAPPQDLA